MSFVRFAACAALLTALLAPGAAPAAPAPVDVAIVTTKGTIVVAVDVAHAPATAKNFLAHVDAHVYDRGATFYRTLYSHDPLRRLTIEVLQGGIQPRADTIPPIPVEQTEVTGLHNDLGTIAMARTEDPASANSEFFINTIANRILDSDEFSDGFGYAVFGRVIKGMNVVKTIQHQPSNGEALTPPVKILNVHRI